MSSSSYKGSLTMTMNRYKACGSKTNTDIPDSN